MITVAGESLVDVVSHADGRTERSPGGSPANVAVGLARLGHDVRFLTRYGDDDDGRVLAGHLQRAGVRVVGAGSGRTSTATARLDEHGSATYEFDLVPPAVASSAAAPLTGECLHVGSLGALAPDATDDALALVRRGRGGRAVSFDPNCRPGLIGSPARAREAVREFLRLSDVVKASDEDLSWLHPGREPLDVAREWLAEGPALVVVTRGGDGCLAVTATGDVAVPSVPVDVVDTVGAGDSFMAALLDALSRAGVLGGEVRDSISRLPGQDVAQALRWAAAAAAITCGRPGADPPTTAELRAATQG